MLVRTAFLQVCLCGSPVVWWLNWLDTRGTDHSHKDEQKNRNTVARDELHSAAGCSGSLFITSETWSCGESAAGPMIHDRTTVLFMDTESWVRQKLVSSCVYLSDIAGRNMSESESSALTWCSLLKNTQNTLRNCKAPQIHYTLSHWFFQAGNFSRTQYEVKMCCVWVFHSRHSINKKINTIRWCKQRSDMRFRLLLIIF